MMGESQGSLLVFEGGRGLAQTLNVSSSDPADGDPADGDN